MYIVLLGAPGAGKGTQASNLSRDFNLVHVASGDLFRQALEQDTELGKQARSYMEKGLLVPDEIVTQMVLARLRSLDERFGVVLDGFPRNLHQAEALDSAFEEGSSESIKCVIYIKVSSEVLQRRLSGRWICRNCQIPYHEVHSPPKVRGVCDKCGGRIYQRSDDKPETVKERLKVYFKETAPLIDYYERTGRLIEVDGEGNVDDISRRINKAIEGVC
jgi:adenylate kinase